MTKVKMKIKSGDEVVVLTGKDKGKTGEVTKVIPSETRVIVSGVNQAKKHRKPTQASPGGIDTIEMPIHVSNVALKDPKSGKATRVGYKTLKDGSKTRIAKKSGETIG
ncbi:MAG: 50S ribosomal protein L24 [Micavibrio sp.]|nr:50S ribosomal protein L24 [Micavibrio sp.]